MRLIGDQSELQGYPKVIEAQVRAVRKVPEYVWMKSRAPTPAAASRFPDRKGYRPRPVRCTTSNVEELSTDKDNVFITVPMPRSGFVSSTETFGFVVMALLNLPRLEISELLIEDGRPTRVRAKSDQLPSFRLRQLPGEN